MTKAPIHDILIEVSADDVAVRPDGQRLSLSQRFLRYLVVFFLGCLLYLLSVLPILQKNHGLFFYYGDYNVQQVPFYILAHRMVKSGELLWTWNVDLGGPVVGDFAFYLLGSPFFWLTIPFKEETVPYLLPYLMALKSGIATLTSFAYLKRYVQPKNVLYAVTGSLLYAFSGFAACNIVFQHFHDIIAFFPFLMLSFEHLMDLHHGKRQKFFTRGGMRLILFALAVTLNAVTSYYFFYGEVLFLIIYFIVRYVPVNDVRHSLYALFHAVAGGVLGLMLGGFFLVQAVMGVAGNGRLSNILTGYATLVYPEAKMPFDLLKALVMIPDIIGKGTLFYTDTVKNSSLAVYLPLFGIGGVAAYLFAKKKHTEDIGNYDYKRVLTIVFAITALVPFFNAAFSLFNTQYYCRWFFMPILMFALMTTEALEDVGNKAWKRGSLLTIFLYLFMVGVACLPSTDAEGNIRYFNMTENPTFFKWQVVGTGIMCVLLLFIVFVLPKRFLQRQITLLLTAASVLITNIVVLHNGASLISYTGMEYWKEQMLDTKPEIQSDVFCRAETDSTSTNYEMVWGIPTIHCFLSTVPAGIFDFYEGVGAFTRTVESDPPLERKGIRALLSAKYYFENALVNTDGEFLRGEGVQGYVYVDSQNGFDIYENENFLPMGLTFDEYILESDFEEVDKSEGDEALVKMLILSDEVAAEYGGRMQQMNAYAAEDFYYEDDFEKEIAKRRQTVCTSFTALNDGFSAVTADLESDALVLFSVPLVKGFHATVDGEEVPLVKADFGLTAVPVEAGVHEIRVQFTPPYLTAGILCSMFAALFLILYGSLSYYNSRRTKYQEGANYGRNDDEPKNLSGARGA